MDEHACCPECGQAVEPEELPTTFGDRLRWQRRRNRLSMRALALAAGVNTSDISRYERGIGEPSISRALALARALETPLATLVGE